nr:hypothetical protein [Candidatus Sigynarchaeota archaeon]
MQDPFYDVLGEIKQDGDSFQVRIEKKKTLASFYGYLIGQNLLLGSLFLLLGPLVVKIIGSFILSLGVIILVYFVGKKLHDETISIDRKSSSLLLHRINARGEPEVIERHPLNDVLDVQVRRHQYRLHVWYTVHVIVRNGEIKLFTSQDEPPANQLKTGLDAAIKDARREESGN